VGGRRIAFKQRLLAGDAEREFVEAYRRAASRLLLLDCDGTLIPFAPTPEAAVPDEELIDLLRRLGEDRRNDVVILSGRDRGFLDAHFGGLPLGLSAEHGVWTKPPGGSWESVEYVVSQWKDEIRVLLESYCDRTPGTQLEEKEYALVWHYRRADSELATQRRAELREDILHFAANLSLSVMEGNKVLEVKNFGISKGTVAARLTEDKNHDFVFAIGDDVTDEDTFVALPESAYTIKVGMAGSHARFNVRDVSAARRLLATLAAQA
jgi:trehalose 6-phosphate synthase/phosphatase